MEQFQITERQLFEDVTLQKVKEIGEYNSVNSQAEKIKEAQQKANQAR